MSLAVTHFAFGAGMALLVMAAWFPDYDRPWTFAVCSGLWALIPDFHYVVPTMTERFPSYMFHVFGNVFWMHASLDGLHQGRGTREMAGVMLLFLLACAMIADARRADDVTWPTLEWRWRR